MATLSGNVKNLGIVNVTSPGSYVQFTLTNYPAGTIPRVVATNIIVSPVQKFFPDSNGDLSGSIQGNDTITPANTRYDVCVFNEGIQQWCALYSVTGGSFDVDAASPVTTPAPLTQDPNAVVTNPVGTQTVDQPAGTSLNVDVLNKVRVAEFFPGTGATQLITNAIGDLPSTGGTVDARSFEGAQTITSDIFSGVTKPVHLILGAATFTLSASVSVPATSTLEVSEGTVIALNAGVTLTISGGFIAPTVPIFSPTGTGKVEFTGARPAMETIWWVTGGAGSTGSPYTSADGTGGLGEAIAALDTVAGGAVHISPGYSLITKAGGVNATNNTGSSAPLQIYGDGMQRSVLLGRNNGVMLDLCGRENTTLRDFMLDSVSQSTPSTIGVLLARTSGHGFSQFNHFSRLRVTIEDVAAANGANGSVGLYNYGAELLSLEDCHFSGNWGVVHTQTNVFSVTSAYQTLINGSVSSVSAYGQSHFQTRGNDTKYRALLFQSFDNHRYDGVLLNRDSGGTGLYAFEVRSTSGTRSHLVMHVQTEGFFRIAHLRSTVYHLDLKATGVAGAAGTDPLIMLDNVDGNLPGIIHGKIDIRNGQTSPVQPLIQDSSAATLEIQNVVMHLRTGTSLNAPFTWIRGCTIYTEQTAPTLTALILNAEIIHLTGVSYGNNLNAAGQVAIESTLASRRGLVAKAITAASVPTLAVQDVSGNDRFYVEPIANISTVDGQLDLVNTQTSFSARANSHIYSTGSSGGAYPFLETGNLILAPRSTASARDVIIGATDGTINTAVVVTRTGDIDFYSSTAFKGTFVHENTANRTYTFPNTATFVQGTHTRNVSAVGTGAATGETDLQTVTVNANNIGATGAIRITAAGTTSGINSTKDIKLYFGTQLLGTISLVAGSTADWMFIAEVYNTSATAQKIWVWGYEATTVDLADYLTAAINTGAGVTIKTTGTTPNSGDEVSSEILKVEMI